MRPFEERYAAALADPQVAPGLLAFQRGWRQSRDAQIDDLEGITTRGFDSLRAAFAAGKEQVRADWGRYLAEFQANAEAAGATVVRLQTAAEANAYIGRLAAGRGATLVVKGKSMVTEETGLNAHLARLGIAAVETDLGEWLLQLAGEHPSHLVMPAIHKRAGQIAALLERVLGRPFDPADLRAMVAAARTELRDRFLASGLGVSGANALVAEGGTVMLVCNEGNNRMSVALPPVHVVVAGIEKVVPTYADAMAQVRLLARSATGQPITTYTSFLTGPRPGQEQHVLLIDNGRSAMAADPEVASALGCIRCGACANVCPPYQVVGGHAFGYVYTGAIGLVNTPYHHGLEAAAGPQSLCVSCGACATVCPADIPLPAQILRVRRDVLEARLVSPLRRLLLRAFASRRLVAAGARVAAVATAPLRRGQFLRLPASGRHLSWRSAPALPVRPARTVLRHREGAGPDAAGEAPRRSGGGGPEASGGGGPEASGGGGPEASAKPHRRMRGQAFAGRMPGGGLTRSYRRMRGQAFLGHGEPPGQFETAISGRPIVLFLQCLSDRVAPSIAVATADLLAAAGASVQVPSAQHCCGLPAYDGGDWRTAARMAKQTIETLESVEGPIVTPAPSCAIAMLHDYPRLLADEPAWDQRAARLAARVYDLVAFLVGPARLPAGALDTGDVTPVTVHRFCQSGNTLGHTDEIERLVRDVCRVPVRDLAEKGVCCGFGGSTSLVAPEVAAGVLDRKLSCVDDTGTGVLITDNPGCVLHLRGGAHASGRGLEVLHVAEYLAARLPAPSARRA